MFDDSTGVQQQHLDEPHAELEPTRTGSKINGNLLSLIMTMPTFTNEYFGYLWLPVIELQMSNVIIYKGTF